MLKKLKKRLKGRRPSETSAVAVQKRGTLLEDYEHTMVAASFAEAGAHDHALQVLERIDEPRKIIVATTEKTFAPQLIDYAIQLAQRLGHEIVALSICTPEEGNSPVAGKHSGAQAGNPHRLRTTESAERFRDEALRQDIAFQHFIREGSVQRVLEDLPGEIRRIDLIITDQDLGSAKSPVAAGLPIFRVVPSG